MSEFPELSKLNDRLRMLRERLIHAESAADQAVLDEVDALVTLTGVDPVPAYEDVFSPIYQAIVDNTRQGIALVHQDRQFFVNDRMALLMGYDPQVYRTLPNSQRTAGIHPDDRDQIRNAVARALRGEELIPPTVLRVFHPDGKMIWLEMRAISTRYHDEPAALLVVVDISERKQREDMLRYEALLLDNVSDAVISTDLEYRILTWNPAAERIYGWSAAEAVGQRMGEFIRAEYPGTTLEAVSREFERTGRWYGEIIQYRRDGVPINVYASVTRIVDTSGNAVGAVAINRDMTADKAVQRALEISESNFRNIFENSVDTFLIFNMEGTLVHVNRAACQLYDYSYDEMIGMSGRMLVHPDYQDRFFDFLSRRKMGDTFQVDSLDVRKDGSTFEVEIYGRVILYSAEQHLLAVVRDISGRKKAEAALREALQRDDLILNHTAEGIFGLDATGQAMFINPRAAELTGYASDELLAVDFHALIHHHSIANLQLPPELCPIRTTLRDGKVRHVDSDVFWRKDGTSFPVEYTATPVKGENDEVTGVVVTFRDVTERNAAERNRMELEVEKERSHALRRFISDMSHDFRTPLATIGTSLYLLRRIHDPQKQGAYIVKAEQQIQRIEQLLEDMLLMYKLDSEIALVVDEIDMHSLIGQVVGGLLDLAARKGVALWYDPDESTIQLHGDELILSRAIRNLIQNAIIYTNKGGRVIVQVQQQKSVVRVDVIDTGIGISQEDLPYIFDRFYRADKARGTNEGGIGLGLSIVRRVVDLMGGQIEVQSEPGKGSTFRLLLPLEPVSKEIAS